MKDISLAKTNAKGEYLYNKVQDIVWDDVLSKYITSPQVSFNVNSLKMKISEMFLRLNFLF